MAGIQLANILLSWRQSNDCVRKSPRLHLRRAVFTRKLAIWPDFDFLFDVRATLRKRRSLGHSGALKRASPTNNQTTPELLTLGPTTMKTPSKKRRSTLRTNSSIEQMEDRKLFAADLLSIAEVGQVAQIAQLDTRLTITQNASISFNNGVVTATATNSNDVITIEEYSIGKIDDFVAQVNPGLNLNSKLGFSVQGITPISATPASTPCLLYTSDAADE